MLSDINLLRVKEKWKTYSADIPKAGRQFTGVRGFIGELFGLSASPVPSSGMLC